MDVLSLSGSTEQPSTTGAKSTTDAQTGQVDGVALPVFGALLEVTRAAQLTLAPDAEALPARQGLAGDGNKLPPEMLVGDEQSQLLPHMQHLPPNGVTQPKVQAFAQNVLTGSTLHMDASKTIPAQPGAPQVDELDVSLAERIGTPARAAPSSEIAPMASASPVTGAPAATGTAEATTELVVGDPQQANLASAARGSNDGLASGIMLPTSSAAGVDQVSVPGMRPTTLALPTRLDAPEWSEAFANRVAWAANSNIQVAELRLNPPQLGHIGVQIAIQNNKADIAIATPHAEVLASIEAALPRLRELFVESGVALGDVDVSQHSPGETPDRDRDTHPRAKFLAAHEVTGETEMALKPLHQGLIDHYV